MLKGKTINLFQCNKFWNFLQFFLVESHSTCSIGDWCQSQSRSIGLTLDDILHDEIQSNTILSNQSFMVKIGVVLTMIMFVGGLISGVLSWITFQSKSLQKAGCVMYLLASSITSLLTISMFTVKFWFVVLTQMNISSSLIILRGGCKSIEPLLKFFVYLDAWLNACVAVERTVNVSKGIHFDKKKSRRIARWIIIILPFCIMCTIIHEPLYRDVFEYHTKKYKSMEYEEGIKASEQYDKMTGESEEYGMETNNSEKYETEQHAWCVTHYSPSLQNYNTAIQFFHLIVPFIANLFFALFIIFGVARQRSLARTGRSYRKHVRDQLNEHRQLIISPLILLALTLPRLIISLSSECVKVSSNQWLYFSGYFISFTPSMLIFAVFVFPSSLYRKTINESFIRWWRRIHQ